MGELKKRIILDFDGTITDIEKETQGFQGMYPYILLDELNLERKYLKRFNEIKEKLRNNLKKGFEIGGNDVMPASCDPYILTQSAGQELIDGLGLEILEKDKLLVDLFLETKKEVGKKETFYREGKERTKEFFDKILENHEVCFVTNASFEKVEKHLKELGNKYFEMVAIYANAGKLKIDNDFKELPKKMCPKGFDWPREVLLRRKEYHQRIEFLKEEKGFYPSITTVIGDIYELDLALPDYLNYNIIQIENGYSKEHERNYLGNRFVNNYNELESLLLD
ncbi:MAG TPA: hypothetical protein VJ895_01095 [Candidatus Nanoarchaeia archaeon]|nr:hypothetical protein [Candidatus Nanoarchaeia archaeon]